jgi:hypothetical protein
MNKEIPDYVIQVLARFGPPQMESDGWVVPCPCQSHGGKGLDRNPSCRITIGDEGKIIVHCRTGCSTEDVLASVGLSFADLYCPAGEEAATPLLFANQNLPTEDKPLDTFHEVYSKILNELSLAESHIKDLEKRGITPKLASDLQYRSLLTAYDQDNLLKKLNSEFKEKLAVVPGFKPCPDKPNQYQFAIDPKGLIIPLRSLSGKVVALKTRRPISPKYILWSTRNGPSAGTPVHCPSARPQEVTTLRITEGEIKADICNHATSTYTVSVPGVNSWPSSLPVIQDLNPRRVLVSFDYIDVTNKGGVARLLRLFAEDLVMKGYEIGLEFWDITNPLAKGVDDALNLKIPLQQIWGNEALQKIRFFHDKERESINFFSAGEPEEFPLEVFPPALREFISQHSQSLQCPEDFMSTAVLAVASRCIGTSRAIGLDDYWIELGNQFMCIVAPPSSGKSPACKRILKPLKKLQKKDALRYASEKISYANAMRDWKEEAREARRTSNPIPEIPQRPRKIEHFWVSDITVETVAKRLHDNSENIRHDPALLYYRDEIISWIKSLNAYRGGKGADREFFLSCWSNEDIKVDRKTDDETIIVSNPALTILGGIQPDVLSDLQSDSSGKDDGFFARLLFSYPVTKVGFEPSSFVPDPGLDASWEIIVKRLLALVPDQETGDGIINPHEILYKPRVIPLSSEAVLVWNEWLMRDTQLMRAPNFPPHLLSAYGKHRAILARIALVLHLINNASIPEGEFSLDVPVSAPSLRAAIKVLDYFRSHYQRVIRAITYTPEDRKIEIFVKHVIENHSGVISLKKIYDNRLFGCKGREDAENLCKKACDQGFGSMEKIPSEGKKPYYCFVVQGA